VGARSPPRVLSILVPGPAWQQGEPSRGQKKAASFRKRPSEMCSGRAPERVYPPIRRVEYRRGPHFVSSRLSSAMELSLKRGDAASVPGREDRLSLTCSHAMLLAGLQGAAEGQEAGAFRGGTEDAQARMEDVACMPFAGGDGVPELSDGWAVGIERWLVRAGTRQCSATHWQIRRALLAAGHRRHQFEPCAARADGQSRLHHSACWVAQHFCLPPGMRWSCCCQAIL
jgi:hypothetical protein